MSFDGFFAEVELVGDFFVAVAFGDEDEDLVFAWAGFGAIEAFGEALCDGGWEPALALCDGADGVEEVGARGGFFEESEGAGADGAVDVFVACEGGEDEDASVWVVLADGGDGFDAAGGVVAELEVHDDDVWLIFLVFGEGVGGFGCFCDDLEVGFECEGGGEAAADNEVVVDEE